MKTLCLNMIVKNESKIIRRALESVRDYINYWVICDTGSTDETINIIKEVLKSIPGELHEVPWKNFGYNRNAALKLAKNKTDYILLLDADMELIVNDVNFKNYLTHDMYKVRQGFGFTYFNVRLLRGDIDFEYVGSTHEYLDCKLPDHTSADLNTIKMNDYADGSNRPDKFKRDIELLLGDLKENPSNTRAMFYIAQSYKDLEDYDNAIKWYKKRAESGGWIEEEWYSKYMIGKCYLGLNMGEMAISSFLEAYNKYPKRMEPLYEIVKYYRINSKYELSHMFYKLAKKIPYPSKDTLFISDDIYNYKLAYEYSIIAYYLNHFEDGYKISDSILHSSQDIPDYIRNNVEKNLIFYLNPLKKYIGHFDNYQLFVNKTKENHNICNPSIIKHLNDLILNIREVSYDFDIEKNIYTYDKTIDTYNHLIYNPKFESGKVLENDNVLTLDDKNIILNPNEYITGFEDLRLISFNNKLYGLCTSIITNLEKNMNEMILFEINENKINNVLRLHGHGDGICQKNWMPFVKNNKINFIYSMDPFVVLEPNMTNGLCSVVVNKKFNYNFSNYRGSSQPIEFDNGLLFIIHTVLFIDSKRKYTHRFVHIDNEYKNIKVSPLFYFIKKTIEFVAGMTEMNGKLLITYGFEDKLAYLASVESNKIRNILKKIDDL